MIVCRSQVEIEKLRRVNQLVARILAELRQMVAPGVTTKEIDVLGRSARAQGGRGASVQGIPRLSGDGVCVDQRAGGARHPLGPAPC